MNKVKLFQIGSDPKIIKEFDLDHAQRILDVRHPQKTWQLEDPLYEMKAGKIVSKTAEATKK